MTATVVATAFGGPDVPHVVDEPLGEVGGGVRVGVKAVGVDPADYRLPGRERLDP
jgi:NADPH:quinone reductase-like Zn-dependent oxidoreductase